MARILLIDDQAEFHFLVRQAVFPHDVVYAQTTDRALTSIEAGAPDLILLDVGLPDSDGFHLFPRLRAIPALSQVPILFLSGKGTLPDRLTGFALGADDYIVKPFEPLEFKARIEARLASSAKSGRDLPRTIHSGNLKLDFGRMRASYLDRDLELSPCEFRLLSHFVTHEGYVASRDQLMTAAWSGDVDILDRTVDRHVSMLRKKLSATGCSIKSVRGMGYAFEKAPVERAS